jgi:hypothetical protein
MAEQQQPRPESQSDFDKWSAELEEDNPGIAIDVAMLEGNPPHPSLEQSNDQINAANDARDKIRATNPDKAEQNRSYTQADKTSIEAAAARHDRDVARQQAKEQKWNDRVSQRKGLPKLATQMAHRLSNIFRRL